MVNRMPYINDPFGNEKTITISQVENGYLIEIFDNKAMAKRIVRDEMVAKQNWDPALSRTTEDMAQDLIHSNPIKKFVAVSIKETMRIVEEHL